MMAVFTVCAVLVIATFLTVFLRGTRPEMALAVVLLAGCGGMLYMSGLLGSAVEYIQNAISRAGMDSEAAGILLKSFGICLLTQFTADVCRDAGETALASHAQTAGKVAMLIPALPLFEQLLELAVAVMNGGVSE